MLCYDAAQGVGEFYYVGEGGITLAQRYPYWRRTWNIIVPGNFGGDSITDLLFYDAAAGTGEFYSTNGGQMNLIGADTTWRGSWKLIVPGSFGGNGYTDLAFYDPYNTTGQFYSVDQGRISLLKSDPTWNNSWDEIIPGDFGGNGFTDLLFYDRTAGVGEFYAVDNGNTGLLRSYKDWRTSWTKILAGKYTGSDVIIVQPPPAPTLAFRLDSVDPQQDWRYMHIFGHLFQAGETVELTITTHNPDVDDSWTDTASTVADSLGNIEYKYYGNSVGVCASPLDTNSFQVQGTGEASHRVSNKARGACSI